MGLHRAEELGGVDLESRFLRAIASVEHVGNTFEHRNKQEATTRISQKGMLSVTCWTNVDVMRYEYIYI